MIVKCPICEKTRKVKLYHSEFYSSGIARCRSCAQLITIDQKSSGRIRHQNGLKKCTICKEWKSLDHFGNDSIRWDKLSPFCRSCNTIRLRSYRQRNREKINEIGQRSYQKHKREANIRSMSHHFFPVAQTCSIMNCAKQGHRHHPDYSDPKKLIWLCRQHHAELHRSN